MELRPCRTSTALLGTAALVYAVAIVAQLGWIMPETGARGVMVEEGAEMVGNLLVLLTMAVHARWVILDAQGLVQAPAEKPKKKPRKAATETTEAMDEKAENDTRPTPASAVDARPKRPAEPRPAPAEIHGRKTVGQPSAPTPPVRAAARIDEAQSAPQRHKLSKAERKAMRRLQRADDDDE
jgi:hypothetical protein